ncbi:MAG: RsmB/NOP family class I SAM-dependent RNA methyltransferase, partial [Rhodospirillales bacterium]
MIPAARLAAAIELGGLADSSSTPPDSCYRDYFRRRRYAGSGDRRAIIARIIDVTRCRSRLDWWIEASDVKTTWRTRVLAHIILVDGISAPEILRLFDAPPYGPKNLTPNEISLAERMSGQHLNVTEMPPSIRHECPSWLYSRLKALWGGRTDVELEALNVTAPVDLRVNIDRTKRETIQTDLAERGLVATPTPYSPWGLRLAPSSHVATTPVISEGLAEIQDEGSQIISLICGATQGMTVVDVCAGAGGKTLALGALMACNGNINGRLIAADAELRRLSPLPGRLRRAGLHGVSIRSEGADRLDDLIGEADRVLVDAPCSGSGTWRRRPDLRWSIQPNDITALTTTQDHILKAAALLVRPAGRLIYATCSLDPVENEERIDRFLATHDTFSLMPIPTAWNGLDAASPLNCSPYLRLSPATTGTDGFFGAVME